jgi:hypothetical protein
MIKIKTSERTNMNYKIIDTNSSQDGLRRVMANNKYGLIDSNNQLICNIDYEEIAFPGTCNAYIMVKRNGKWTSIDKFGNNRITLQMDDYYDFFGTNPKYAAVTVDKQLCIIDQFGNIIIEEKSIAFDIYGKYIGNIEWIELFGNKFAFFYAQEETLIVAYDIETKRCPDFWTQIYGRQSWVTNIRSDRWEGIDIDGNLLYRTTSKEYTIDKNGNIIKTEPLPFKLKTLGLFAKYIAAPIMRQEMKKERENKEKNA